MRFCGRFISAALLATLTLGPIGAADAHASRRPSAPRALAAAPLNAAVRLTWSAPINKGGSRIDRYAVQRRSSTTAAWVTVRKVIGSVRTWTSTGLRNGRRYYFRVRAHNRIGFGLASAQVSAVPRTAPAAGTPAPPPAPTPGTPLNLAGVVQPGESGYVVKLAWSPPANAASALVSSYTIQRAVDNAPYEAVGTTPDTTYLDPITAFDTQYTYRVIPVGASGIGAPGDVPVSTRLVSIDVASIEVTEGSTATFQVTLAYVSTNPTTITITSSDPNAAVAENGQVTIPTGSTTGIATIHGVDDPDSLDENLTMTADLGPSSTTLSVTVHDDDVP